MSGLVTLGEVLAVARSQHAGPLGSNSTLRLSAAGSEANVAIGVRRLGASAHYIGRVGDDSLGIMIAGILRAEGVTSTLVTDQHRGTAFMMTERRLADVRRVQYYRAGSAGSALGPRDIDKAVIAEASVVHVTGITTAISPSAHAAASLAIDHAHAHGVPVSFDLNYRAALAEPAVFRAQVGPLLGKVSLLFASVDEAQLLIGPTASPDPVELFSTLHQLGPGEVVLTDGSKGAWASNGIHHYRQLAIATTAADPVGAGDAFVAGYLAARLDGAGIAARLSLAAEVAAVCVATDGDWEGLPRHSELDLLRGASGSVRR